MPITPEPAVKAGRSAQGHPWLYSELKANLKYTDPVTTYINKWVHDAQREGVGGMEETGWRKRKWRVKMLRFF